MGDENPDDDELLDDSNGQSLRFTHRHANKILVNYMLSKKYEKEVESMKAEVKELTKTMNRVTGALILLSVAIPLVTTILVKHAAFRP